MKKYLFLLLFTMFFASPIYSQNEACMDCHSDNELTMERAGKEISIFVNGEHYLSSIHADMECVDCHEDFDPDEIPHRDGDKIYKVDCSSCHEIEDYIGSAHEKKKLECFSCHTKHNIKEVSDLIAEGANQVCLDCHNTSEFNGYNTSAHAEIYSENDQASCLACHGESAHAVKVAKFSYAKQMSTCNECHSDVVNNFQNDIHQRLKSKVGNNAPDCIQCHTSHNVLQVSKIKNKSDYYCSSCHSEPKEANNYHSKTFVSSEACADCHEVEEMETELALSVHPELACSDCHAIVASNLTAHEQDPEFATVTNCASCHADVAAEHRESLHGDALLRGIDEAANCSSCHGSHNILSGSDRNSTVHPANVSKTCSSCHDDPEFAKKFDMSASKPGQLYEKSVHVKIDNETEIPAATCVSCHGVHNIKSRLHSDSKINILNLSATCAECHEESVSEYENSIHWFRASRGVREAPSCNDCHNAHSIMEITNGNEIANRLKIQENTCERCHAGNRLAEKFGKTGGQVEEYLDSYHGLAAARGYKDAALCVDCHESHSILRSTNEEASTHASNVTETCAKCHENATDVFSQSYSHQTSSDEARAVEDFVDVVYFWLIVVIIGGMVLHNLLIFVYELKKKRSREKLQASMPRMTKNEIIQHILLLSSFIALAVTGFALKYTNSFWSEGLLQLGMTEEVRKLIHRISAVVMMVLGLYHIIYLFVTARGRDVLKKLLPNIKDAVDAFNSLKYFLGFSKVHPKAGKYDYAEKAEYWALIWGTLVMGVTGLFLWFPTLVGDWAPLWLIKVSEIIHFYEAVLATLAIIVWHWFFVIFRPSQYPVSFAWLSGTIPLSEYREHHEDHFREIALEIRKHELGIIPENKLSNFSRLFLENCKKEGNNPFEVINEEIHKSDEFEKWMEDEITKATS
jgi:predicted CXXCH cytochrome family protein